MEEIKVSVLCTAYNHEKFLRKCLDGFVMQKTNFKFEVIVHDDASTDGTKKIIEEYMQKYPKLFVPIFQTENKYSKGILIFDDIMYPLAKGKYIAVCEGDDYWCNENKLQLQYDFMEGHPECSACFTNTIFHDMRNIDKDRNYNNWKEIHFLTPLEAINPGIVHTSTHFARKEYAKAIDFGRKYSFGDLVKQTTYYLYGEMAVLPQTTSVYNAFNPTGVTNEVFGCKDAKYIIERIMEIKDYLDDYNVYTNYKYDYEIHYLYGTQIIGAYNYAIERLTDYKEKKKLFKQLKKEPDYIWYRKNIKGMTKIKEIVRASIPLFVYELLRKIKKRGKKL